jgi:protein-S-isoprenylcysteine O-methyltransferase Ste14
MTPSTRWSHTVATAYGVAVYVGFLALFVYFVGWIEGLGVPRAIDDGPTASTATAIVVDVALLAMFAAQHSVMARPAFKRAWARVVPPPIERSTYVLFATATWALVMWQWRPLPEAAWDIESTAPRVAVYAVSFGGWALVLAATFMIDHLDMFGLRQVLRHRAGQPPTTPGFATSSMYRIVRHPLYLGFLIAFWAAPTMTQGRLLFACGTSAYVVLAARLEERDLIAAFGDRYRTYRHTTPALLPHRLQRRTTERRHQR